MTIEATFTSFPSLTTKRLLLRQIQPEDAEAVFATLSDEEVLKFYGSEPHRSVEDSRQWIQRQQHWYGQREAMRWGIILKGEGMVIGSVGFHHFGSGFHHAEIGYELNRAYWRKGIMSEAVSAILTYGFTELELHRIEANIDIANEASKNLLLKLGFTYEGILRERFFFRDCFEDEHYFGLLRDEWRGLSVGTRGE